MIGMYWHRGYHGGWSWVLPGITFMLFVLLVIVVLVALWRMYSTSRTPGSGDGKQWGSPPHGRVPEAERLLAERLARGEIDVDEYRHRLAALRGEYGGSGPGSPPGDGPPGGGPPEAPPKEPGKS
ncbi:SHOCT domain-containing protein [Kitasatospora griseola]|uniref:SHOCT domain-containing protein n=1 Tax=Kitasatospora griseola TaxID=2064 RepID=UPI003656AFD4